MDKSKGSKELESNTRIFDFNLDQVKEIAAEVVQKSEKNLTKEVQESQINMLVDVFANNKSMQDVLKISDDKLTLFYQYASSLFRSGKYKEALEVFQFLTTVDPSHVDYFLGVAICYHRLKDYMQAYSYYIFCSELDWNDPLPLFYAYDCLHQFNDIDGCRLLLERVIERSLDQPKYDKIKERAELYLAGLSAVK